MQLDLWTSSQADTRASHSVSPGSEQARRMTATSGQKCIGSWLRSGPLGLLERMFLGTSAWGSTKCFLTWKPWTTPGGRLLFRLVPSMPRTDGIAYGLWPTATQDSATERSKKYAQGGSPLSMAVGLMPTMTAGQGARSQLRSPQNIKNYTSRIEEYVALWPTPRAIYGEHPGMKDPRHLTGAAQLYPTMDVGAAKGLGQASADGRSRLGGSLNPTWVELLMGYPPGYTEV